MHELDSGLGLGKGWSPDIDTQDSFEPEVLAHTLVNHLFMYAPAPGVLRVRAGGEFLVLEHTPDTQHLDALCFVGVHDKPISHRDLHWL